MICPDCIKFDEITSTCLFDRAQCGEVCPRCERVYSPVLAPNQLHYVTKEATMRRMKRDRAERKNMSVSTQAVTERILEGRI